MTARTQGLLESIGNTPLVELRRMQPPRGARVLAKLEGNNSTNLFRSVCAECPP